MQLELILEPENCPSGWVLIESRLESGRHDFSCLMVHRDSAPGQVEKIPLPVLPDGRIHELIRLPEDVGKLVWRPPERGQFVPSDLSLRRIGWPERTLRMAIRVTRTYLRLSEDQRSEAGLSLWRAVFDLHGAFQIASAFRVPYPESAYSDWIERFDTLEEPDVLRIRADVARRGVRPRFHLLLAADATGREALQATLASLRGQLYRDYTCTIVDCAGALDTSFAPDIGAAGDDLALRVVTQEAVPSWLAGLNGALAGRTDEWVMLLHAGDVLPAHALYWFASEAQARPDAAIVYSDDDALDAEGRRSHPRFKPDWSPAHLRSTHFVGAAAILRGSDVAAAGGVSVDCCRHGNYDLLLRVIDSAGERIAHLPAVLFHRRGGSRAADAWEDPQWCAGAVRAHLARNGVAAEVTRTLPACRRIRYRLPDAPPLVSIIVPTRDAAALLRQCVDSVLEKTTYPRFEILVIDNRSTDPEALAYLAKIAGHPAVRVLRYDRPFNYSTINNYAAGEARGEMLCLLNNDTEVISPDWLEEMAGHLLQRQVGAVGAKLYYPDGRVQHAGVAVGPGSCASHLHPNLARDAAGYCNRAMVAQEGSAVTAACLLTWKHLYQRLEGLNEGTLTVAFNDVDYCLRLQESGHRVIFTPHAELVHHESATRGSDDSLRKRLRARREVKYMRMRWRERMKHDPYYNPNLSYRRPDFSLSETPRVKKPWSQ